MALGKINDTYTHHIVDRFGKLWEHYTKHYYGNFQYLLFLKTYKKSAENLMKLSKISCTEQWQFIKFAKNAKKVAVMRKTTKNFLPTHD